MKRLLTLVFMAISIVGCGNTQPQTPVSSVYKFNGIEYKHIQFHQPTKFEYQSPESVERKYNEQILQALKEKNKLDQNSEYELKISIEHRREFVGEATPLKSDRMGNILVKYKILAVKNAEILRSLTTPIYRYDPGFWGNLKSIAMQNTDDTLENNAIEKIVKYIMEDIENF